MSTTIEIVCGLRSTKVMVPEGSIVFKNKTMSETQMPSVQFDKFISTYEAMCPFIGFNQTNLLDEIRVTTN